MRALLIFDSGVEIGSLSALKKESGRASFSVFPLTSDLSLTDKLLDSLKAMGCADISLLNSAESIDREVKPLRSRIIKWSAELSGARIKGKNLRDHLVLPGEKVSAWWFGLLSEKNTVKTDRYFKIAQLSALKRLLSEGGFSAVYSSLSDRLILEALRDISAQSSVMHRELRRESVWSKAARCWGNSFPKRFLSALKVLLKMSWRKALCFLRLGDLKKRIPATQSLLFVTYFPYVDREAALRGEFRNKYAPGLQERIAWLKIPTAWLFMYYPVDGKRFEAALKMALSFRKKGEDVFFIEEFLAASDFIRALFLWLWLALKGALLLGRRETASSIDAIGRENRRIVKELWRDSFSGRESMYGILYYFIFKNAFRDFKGIKNCLYYCEMHAWEKALNAAKSAVAAGVNTIGFQHCSVSRNYFHYFYDPDEISSRALPLPDKFVCNGERLRQVFAESGYVQLRKAESFRYLHLEAALGSAAGRDKRERVLLVVGSIKKEETIAMLNLVHRAFPDEKRFRIWFKAHPALPENAVFKQLDFDPARCGIETRRGNLSDYLPLVSAALVPTSSVSIEALAFGCEVIVPVFADSMLMNPLSDFEGYSHKVYSAEELRAAMEKVLSGRMLRSAEEYRDFVKDYWMIDPRLSAWEELLV